MSWQIPDSQTLQFVHRCPDLFLPPPHISTRHKSSRAIWLAFERYVISYPWPPVPLSLQTTPQSRCVMTPQQSHYAMRPEQTQYPPQHNSSGHYNPSFQATSSFCSGHSSMQTPHSAYQSPYAPSSGMAPLFQNSMHYPQGPQAAPDYRDSHSIPPPQSCQSFGSYTSQPLYHGQPARNNQHRTTLDLPNR